MKILILNAGSSSQKSCLYDLPENTLPDDPIEPIWIADIDWTIATGQGILTVKANKIKEIITLQSDDRRQGIAQMLHTLIEGSTQVIQQLSDINIVGHRVVHGGINYSKPTLITPEVKATINRLIPLAPNHNPAHLEGIEAIEKLLENIPQIAIFDTAFHSQIPLKASVYPIPYQWFDQGIRRYVFH